jgi:phosphate-selective porin OprO/OprP
VRGTFDDGHAQARIVPDFAGGKLVVQDAYVDLKYLDWITLRAGKMKVPFGLERLQYEGTTMFVERGLPTQIAPNRDVGVELFGTIARGVQWQLGVFDGVPDGAIGDGDLSDSKDYVGRVFVVPSPCPHSPLRGLGFGVAATYGHDYGTASQPELPAYKTQGGTTFVSYDSTAVADGTRWRVSGQGHWFFGPFGALGEYARSQQRVANSTGIGEVTADAWQVEAQWVVTGDDATYGGVKPREALDPAHHRWGAIDVVARYDELRVNGGAFTAQLLDPAKAARRARGYGVGVDWFLSEHVRATLDGQLTTFRLGFANATDRPDELVLTARMQASF